jgi:hypothetical protein
MKTISVSVLNEDYEAFRRGARRLKLPIAHLIREAMAYYRAERLDVKPRLTDLPVLVGHRPVASLPGREALYDEVFATETRVAEP